MTLDSIDHREQTFKKDWGFVDTKPTGPRKRLGGKSVKGLSVRKGPNRRQSEKRRAHNTAKKGGLITSRVKGGQGGEKMERQKNADTGGKKRGEGGKGRTPSRELGGSVRRLKGGETSWGGKRSP